MTRSPGRKKKGVRSRSSLSGLEFPFDKDELHKKLMNSHSESVVWLARGLRQKLMPALNRSGARSPYERELAAICERVTDAVGSLALLSGDKRHYQAIAAIARLIFELVGEFTLLAYYDDQHGAEGREQRAVNKLRAFEKAQQWTASHRVMEPTSDPETVRKMQQFQDQLRLEIEGLLGSSMNAKSIKALGNSHWLQQDARIRFRLVDELIARHRPTSRPNFEEGYLTWYRFASCTLHGPGRMMAVQLGAPHANVLWDTMWDWARQAVCEFMLSPLSETDRFLPCARDREGLVNLVKETHLIRFHQHVVEHGAVVSRFTEWLMLLPETLNSMSDYLEGFRPQGKPPETGEGLSS